MPVPIMSSRTALSETATTPHGPGIVARRGRRPTSVNVRAKLERSRQSARECRERKKLRYQYLEELIANREKAIFLLRKELEMVSK
jgi:Basic region leucine zipper